MNHKKIAATLGALCVVLLIHGCGGMGGIKANPDNPIKTVAILPMVNNSDDVEAPQKVRKIFHERLQSYFYNVQPLAETDKILNEQMGITLGKQLELTNPQQLGEKLGVDGVFYGFLINYDQISTGIYNQNKVRMGWKLVNTKTGEISWGRGIAIKSDTGSGVAGAIADATMDVSDAVSDNKVTKMPASADPMAEMPGLDQWVEISGGSSSSSSLTGSLISTFGGKVLDSMTGNRLKKETEYAFDKLFPGMLVGPGT
ncbi:MAG: hypothetical protein AMJ53_00555 [Gammaproteobacteria bacterium SG8_11]|nr:MAG: hypothetical protein AMJ53_00555 [Gammaproteobacteria bacterium SG8_11]